MGIEQNEGSDSSNDVARVTRETAARLGALGMFLDGRETPEELVQVEEAVERFERLVELRGGDLMVDEGSGRMASEPDDSHFATPVRRDHETIAAYLERLARATDDVRRHRPRP
jgi:hypothetical protein